MTTSAGIPVPYAMDMKWDLANNWKYFKETWNNYKIAIELDTKNGKVRVATLLAIIDKETLQTYRHLPMSKEKWKNP